MGKDRNTARDRNSTRKELCKYLIIIMFCIYNFNNTFFDKVLPYTTAVATEIKAKIQ